MAPAVKVVGIGPGSKDYITTAAKEALAEAQVLVGGKRLLNENAMDHHEKFELHNNLGEVLDYICDEMHRKQIAVLVSGDTGIFSFATYLRRKLNESEMEFIPGVSSFQVLFARIKRNWEKAAFFNVHGKMRPNLPEEIKEEELSVLFTGNKWSPPAVASHLLAEGVEDLTVVVGKNLSYPQEKICWMKLGELASSTEDWNNSLLVVFNEK